MQKTPLTPEIALERLRKLCVRREMCSFDVTRRLILWGFDSTRQVLITEQLIQDKFIDNQRFAIAFARDKSRFDKWGRDKIKQALKVRKIPPEMISRGLEEIAPETETAHLEKLLSRKFESFKEGTDRWEMRNKLIRFGLGRGYELQDILQTLKRLLPELP